jgi:hypothetical protein
MGTPPRTPETVTREIELERDRLATAVSTLRGDLHAAATPRAVLRATWPGLAAIGALVGIAVTIRIVLGRRRSEPDVVREVVRARFGRFTVLERL